MLGEKILGVRRRQGKRAVSISSKESAGGKARQGVGEKKSEYVNERVVEDDGTTGVGYFLTRYFFPPRHREMQGNF